VVRTSGTRAACRAGPWTSSCAVKPDRGQRITVVISWRATWALDERRKHRSTLTLATWRLDLAFNERLVSTSRACQPLGSVHTRIPRRAPRQAHAEQEADPFG